MVNDPIDNLQKMLKAMGELMEALKLQQEMITTIAQQQIKTADWILQLGKKIDEKQDKFGAGKSNKSSD